MLRELAQVFTGAFLRSVAGVQDVGEVVLGFFKDPDGGSAWHIADDLADIWVTVQSAMEDTPTGKIVARLFIPMNMLWNLPTEDESCMVARGADAAGPGKPYALYGDAGKAQQVPQWLDKNNAGISTKKKVHLESTGDDVDVTASAAGKTVNVNGTDYEMLKGPDLLTDLATNWNKLINVLNAGTQGSPAAQTLTGLATVLADLEQFGTDLAGTKYKSTKAKNG